MSDASPPVPRTEQDPKPGAAAGAAAVPAAPEEWKPEPRQWTWKDLFTAPMLAFKPKCMLVSMVTLAAITALMWLYDEKLSDPLHRDSVILRSVVEWLFLTGALVIFSLGASLVAVFLKADLLDDEFLSFSEALGQYKDRILPAVLVPLFLMGLLAGVELALVYLPYLAGSVIPFAGPAIYALFYPLLYLFSLFSILLGVAVWLSVFVFPAIVSIRKHGWFDNVVDTIEAVGTKPHVLAASLALTLVMMYFAHGIGFAAIQHLRDQHFLVPEGWPQGVQSTEARAEDFFARDMVHEFDTRMRIHFDAQRLSSAFSTYRLFETLSPTAVPTGPEKNAFYYNVTGPIAGLWLCLIEAMLLGYVLNLFISGGMLTYLVVREDDYWDDENLEDLDKLAKELEEEAKRDQGAAPAAASAPPAAPPAPPAAPQPPAQPT